MVTKYRGAMVSPFAHPDNFVSALPPKHNANILRYPILTESGVVPDWNMSEWKNFVRECLDYLDNTLLPLITDDTKIVLDIHAPPGGMTGHTMNLFTTKPWGRIALLDMWEEIAVRYKYNDKIWVYGILNEPGGKIKQVNSLMLDAVNRIRNVDKHKRIAVTTPYSDPERFSKMAVMPGKRIWYEGHMYHPLKITHQGLGNLPAGIKYPNSICTKKKLMQFLKPLRDFQTDNNVKVYIGEFSISAFADIQSRVNYLTDVINIFQSFNWHWGYHAWRGAPVWNMEDYPEVAKVVYDQWNKNVV